MLYGTNRRNIAPVDIEDDGFSIHFDIKRKDRSMKVKNNVFILEATRKSIHYGQLTASSMVYAAVEECGITLIDSGFPSFANDILEELRQIGEGRPLKRILLTHADVDHIGNAHEMQQETGCTVYISKDELPYIYSNKRRFGQKQQMCEDLLTGIPKLETYPNGKVDDFTIIPTPGHSEGHVCILYKDVLFPGDLCSFIDGSFKGPSPMWTEDMLKANESLKKLSRYSFSLICPAHGLPTERKNRI